MGVLRLLVLRRGSTKDCCSLWRQARPTTPPAASRGDPTRQRHCPHALVSPVATACIRVSPFICPMGFVVCYRVVPFCSPVDIQLDDDMTASSPGPANALIPRSFRSPRSPVPAPSPVLFNGVLPPLDLVAVGTRPQALPTMYVDCAVSYVMSTSPVSGRCASRV